MVFKSRGSKLFITNSFYMYTYTIITNFPTTYRLKVLGDRYKCKKVKNKKKTWEGGVSQVPTSWLHHLLCYDGYQHALSIFVISWCHSMYGYVQFMFMLCLSLNKTCLQKFVELYFVREYPCNIGIWFVKILNEEWGSLLLASEER